MKRRKKKHTKDSRHISILSPAKGGGVGGPGGPDGGVVCREGGSASGKSLLLQVSPGVRAISQVTSGILETPWVTWGASLRRAGHAGGDSGWAGLCKQM